MPALQQVGVNKTFQDITSTDTSSPLDMDRHFEFNANTPSPTGESLMSISDLLGLNLPRGHTLGTSSSQSHVLSPHSVPFSPLSTGPSAASTPVHQGMRPSLHLSYTGSVDSGFDSPDALLKAMPSSGTGYDLSQPFSPLSPISYAPRAIRGSSPYSDCSSPTMEQPVMMNSSQNSRSDSPADSDISSASSYDISITDMMNGPSAISSPPTDQELFNLHNLHALNTLTANSTQSAIKYLQTSLINSLLNIQISDNRWPTLDNNGNALEKIAKFHRSAAGKSAALSEATCTWSGQLPLRIYKTPTFSCKVFLGGVPWDVTEATLISAFQQFGTVKVEWPGKDQAANQPKGCVYIIFESEKQVKALLDCCTHDVSIGGNNWFFRISSRKMKSKEVQVIPWSIGESNFVRSTSQKLDPQTTVFVGALHGMMNAEGLSQIMNDLFGGVIYAGIDTDKYKYPIGSGRVTFNNARSYMKAVVAAFIEIKTSKFTKKVQVDPYLEDSPCAICGVQQGPYFCRELMCFRYFCRTCWSWHHGHQGVEALNHKPLMRNSKNTNLTSMSLCSARPSSIGKL